VWHITLCVTPKSPKGWLKTRIFTFGVAFHFFVVGNHRHFKFGMWVEHSKFQPTDDKPSLKWASSRHVTHFKFLVLPRVIAKTSNLMYRLNVQVIAYRRQTVADMRVVRSCNLLKFWDSNHITGMAEPKVVEFCTHVGYINSRNRMIYHPQKGCGLWSRDCF